MPTNDASTSSSITVNVPPVRRSWLSWKLLVCAVVVGVVLGAVVTMRLGSVFGSVPSSGSQSESTNTQVVRSIEFKQDITLLSLSVDAVATQENSSHIGSWKIPGTSQTAIMRYGFDAKLGIDGSKVTIEQTGESSYTITVPSFEFLAYDNFAVETVSEDGGVLSGITPDIDKEEMVNGLINDETKAQHVADNVELLKIQCENFYNNIVHAIDPDIVLTFVYTDVAADAA